MKVYRTGTGASTAGRHSRFMGIVFRICIFSLAAFPLFTAGCNYDTGANVLSNGGTAPTDANSVRETLSRYTMPSELSAVPVAGDAETPAGMDGMPDLPYAAADPETDYSRAKTRTYVEENTLAQFNWLEQILDAVNQTEYENEIGNGYYKAMVANETENEGRAQKQLQAWIVESEAVTEDGETYLRVRAWIGKTFEPDSPVAKAEFKIYTPPTQNADGTYQDYGAWDMNVKLDDIGDDDYFAASCRAAANGFSVVKLYERISGEAEFGEAGLETRVKAVMYRSASEGYGKIYYPDYDAYYCPDCDQSAGIPHQTVVYAYNDNYLALSEEDSTDVVYKNRKQMVLMTHRYGLFDAATGENVLKSKTFGFPIRYTGNGTEVNAYYGVWQGRHEIWAPEEVVLAEGAQVSRVDVASDSDAETYTVGKPFPGVLVKSTYQTADLEDIENMPVEVHVNREYNLNYADGKWKYCTQLNWGEDPVVCVGDRWLDFDETVGFETLISSADNFRKTVWISGWDDDAGQEKYFVYEAASAANNQQAGFYEAEEVNSEYGPLLRVVVPRRAIDVQKVSWLWVNVSGSIYLEYKGADTGWVEKTVTYFDEFTWTPKFAPDGDQPYKLTNGMEFYVDMQGTGYVVRKEDNVVSVMKEQQTVCNPVNVNSILPDGADTVFYDQWNPEANSTYGFITDPNDARYMNLVFRSVGDNDIDATGVPLAAVGDVAPGRWGIRATINGVETSFNWEYNAFSDAGRVQFLMSDGKYKLLDDPLFFEAVDVQNTAGQVKQIVLGYDGWMIGLPDLYAELEKNEWVMSKAIQDKIINLPAGTALTDAVTGNTYLVKPLERSLFLTEVSDPGGLGLTAARAVSLSDVPIYEEHGMGDMPAVSTVSYSEGLPVK